MHAGMTAETSNGEQSETPTESLDQDEGLIFKVCLYGPNVGKTAFLHRSVNNKILLENEPTVGVDFALFLNKDPSDKARVQLWDIASREMGNAIERVYADRMKAIILFCDVSQLATQPRQALETIAQRYSDLLQKVMKTYEKVEQHRVFIMATRSDLVAEGTLQDIYQKAIEIIQTISTLAFLKPLLFLSSAKTDRAYFTVDNKLQAYSTRSVMEVISRELMTTFRPEIQLKPLYLKSLAFSREPGDEILSLEALQRETDDSKTRDSASRSFIFWEKSPLIGGHTADSGDDDTPKKSWWNCCS